MTTIETTAAGRRRREQPPAPGWRAAFGESVLLLDETAAELDAAGQAAAAAFEARLASLDDALDTLHAVRCALQSGIERAVEARYPVLVHENRALHAKLAELQERIGPAPRPGVGEDTEPLPPVRESGRGRRGIRRGGKS